MRQALNSKRTEGASCTAGATPTGTSSAQLQTLKDSPPPGAQGKRRGLLSWFCPFLVHSRTTQRSLGAPFSPCPSGCFPGSKAGRQLHPRTEGSEAQNPEQGPLMPREGPPHRYPVELAMSDPTTAMGSATTPSTSRQEEGVKRLRPVLWHSRCKCQHGQPMWTLVSIPAAPLLLSSLLTRPGKHGQGVCLN